MKKKMNENNKVKFLNIKVVIGLVLVTVAIISTLLIYFFYVNDYERRGRERQLDELVTQQAGFVDTFFDSQKLLLSSLAYIIQDYELDEARVQIGELSKNVPMDHLWIADSAGDLIYNEKTISVGYRDYFKKSMRGETLVTDVEKSFTGEPFVVVSTPIFKLGRPSNDESKPVAVLFGVFNKPTLTQCMQESTFGGTGLIFLINGSGKLMTQPSAEIDQAFLQFTEQNPDYKNGKIYELMVNGAEYFLSTAKSSNSDWVVCSITPQGSIDNFVSMRGLPFLFLLPLVLLISIVFASILYLMYRNFISLRLRDEKFHLAVGQLSSLLFEYDIATGETEFLQTSSEISEIYKPQKLTNFESVSSVLGEVTAESQKANREMLAKIKAGAQNASCTIEVPLAKNESKYFSVTMSSVKNKNGTPYYALGIINDITQKRVLENALNEKINHDVLTGLLNRESFERAVSKILSSPENKGKMHAFLVGDIDNFKQINDTYGHLTGDVLLQKVSNIFSYIFSKKDLVSRFGGDEFIVFLNDITSAKVAISKAKMICEEMEGLTLSNDIHEKFSMSQGLSFAPKDGEIFYDLYRKADEALYRAKHYSGNSYAIYDSFSECEQGQVPTKEQQTAEKDEASLLDAELDLFYREVQTNMTDKREEVRGLLQNALDNREVELYIQPKFCAKDRALESAEVLARWNSPRYGLLSPNRFIPLFEKMNMMETFDLYMLKATCQKLKEWKDKGYRVIPLSVNQSPLLLLTSGYADILKNDMSENGVSAQDICIEITERAVFSSYRTITKVVQALKELGVAVSLDDFGSGYTSLNMLKNLHIGELKIDKQFIDRLSFQKQRSHVIIKHIISLAKELGIKTTMEGIETEEQAVFVKSVGCNVLQGYLFARPMPNEEFENNYLKNVEKEENK